MLLTMAIILDSNEALAAAETSSNSRQQPRSSITRVHGNDPLSLNAQAAAEECDANEESVLKAAHEYDSRIPTSKLQDLSASRHCLAPEDTVSPLFPTTPSTDVFDECSRALAWCDSLCDFLCDQLDTTEFPPRLATLDDELRNSEDALAIDTPLSSAHSLPTTPTDDASERIVCYDFGNLVYPQYHAHDRRLVNATSPLATSTDSSNTPPPSPADPQIMALPNMMPGSLHESPEHAADVDVDVDAPASAPATSSIPRCKETTILPNGYVAISSKDLKLDSLKLLLVLMLFFLWTCIVAYLTCTLNMFVLSRAFRQSVCYNL